MNRAIPACRDGRASPKSTVRPLPKPAANGSPTRELVSNFTNPHFKKDCRMHIVVNGQTEAITKSTLQTFIQQKKLQTEGLVVEYNRRIIPQARWGQIELQEDDHVELLSFVGGG
jgi:sulfur carrier protein